MRYHRFAYIGYFKQFSNAAEYEVAYRTVICLYSLRISKCFLKTITLSLRNGFGFIIRVRTGCLYSISVLGSASDLLL